MMENFSFVLGFEFFQFLKLEACPDRGDERSAYPGDEAATNNSSVDMEAV